MFYTGEHFKLSEHFLKWKRTLQIDFPASIYLDFPAESWTFLFQCKSCDFGIFFPIYEGSIDYYNTITKSHYYEGTRIEFLESLRLLKATKPNNLLEVGPGSGVFLKQVLKIFPNIDLHAIEINPNVGESLSEIAMLYKSIRDVHETNLDVVCAFQLIEHVANPSEFVYDCNRILKRNGIILLSTPNYDGPVRFYYDSPTETPPHHLTRWNSRSIRILLARNGFKDIRVIKLPLSEGHFKNYIQPIWHHVIRKFHVLNDDRYSSWGNKICSTLVKFKVKQLPFISHNILAVGKRS